MGVVLIINENFDGGKDMLYLSLIQVPPWCQTSSMHACTSKCWTLLTNIQTQTFVCVPMHALSIHVCAYVLRLEDAPAVVPQVPYTFCFCFCLSVYCFETGSFSVLELTKYARLAGQQALDLSVSTSTEMEFWAHIIHPGFLYMDSGTELRSLCQIKPSHQSQKHEFVYLVLGLFVYFQTGSNYVSLVVLEFTM